MGTDRATPRTLSPRARAWRSTHFPNSQAMLRSEVLGSRDSSDARKRGHGRSQKANPTTIAMIKGTKTMCPSKSGPSVLEGLTRSTYALRPPESLKLSRFGFQLNTSPPPLWNLTTVLGDKFDRSMNNVMRLFFRSCQFFLRWALVQLLLCLSRENY